MVMNSFSFCLYGKLFISFHSEGQLCWVEYSWLAVFSFSTLTVSCHSLLACKVSAEKSTDSLMGVPLCETTCFSLATFKIPSLSLTSDILFIMCLGVGPFGFTFFGSFWASCFWMSVYFPRLGKFSAIILG